MHVIEAARLLLASNVPVRFVLCGAGERLDEYKSAADGLSNVVFPGWVDKAKIQVLMRRSVAGLDPLPERSDFLATINNKAIIYLSAGLPVLSSPRRGVLFEFLNREQSGLSYDASDAKGLARIAEDLIADPKKRDGMAVNAGQVYREKFAPGVVLSSMAAYLSEAANSE